MESGSTDLSFVIIQREKPLLSAGAFTFKITGRDSFPIQIPTVL
jgi:hypothetical protein